ncbi:MAG: hypothetical protein WBW48_07075 [Anaerolineae bacterium]
MATHQRELLPDQLTPGQVARDAERTEYLERLREKLKDPDLHAIEGSPSAKTLPKVAKLGSRLNGIEKVEGSSPSGSTNWRMADSLWLMAYSEG